MKQYLYIALFCFVFSIAAKAQNYSIADTFYYSFKDNIQMIELVYIDNFLNNISNANVDYNKRKSLFMDSKVNYSNVYIFRDKSGKILNIYGKNSKDLDVNKLRPVAENFFSQHFLLYQYSLSNYSNKDSIVLLPFIADNGKKGIINQKGEIVVEPIYDEFYRFKSNIIVANESIIIYINEQKNNIVNIGKRLKYYYTNYRRNYTDFIFFDKGIFSIYHKKLFLFNNELGVRFEEDYKAGGLYYKLPQSIPISDKTQNFFMKSKVEVAAAEKDKK